MSFPGYLRSLNLVNKREDESGEDSKDARPDESHHQDDRQGAHMKQNHTGSRSSVSHAGTNESIIDEKGNGPTKSLWVGNIPPRTTSSELRALFSRFGAIVSTKPQAKYAFVNFEQLEHAIEAWKQYHDRDIFGTGYSTINIRFTSSLAEAKQVKDDQERKTSMTSRAEAARKQWFHPTDVKTTNSTPNSLETTKWPNGKPPTGPKSQRCEISPPPICRGDSYRPFESVRGERSKKLAEYRRSGDEREHAGQYRARSDDHYSPAYSPARSNSPSDYASSIINEEKLDPRDDDDSPLPWQRSETRKVTQGDLSIEDSTQKIASTGNSFSMIITRETQLHEPENLQQNDASASIVQAPIASVASLDLQISDSEQDFRSGDTRRPSGKVVPDANETSDLLSPSLGFKHFSKSPSLRPLERLRVENEYSRGSSVLSEVATSSSKTSIKKRRCQDCKKPASDLSPLIQCSKCTRRFHSGCGDPRPSTFNDKSKFTCARCQRKEATQSVTVAALTTTCSATRSQLLFNQQHGKSHLVSPPLSLSHDGVGSATLSPRENMSQVNLDEHSLKSFFLQNTEHKVIPLEAERGSSAWHVPLEDNIGHAAQHATVDFARDQTSQSESAFEKKKRYKFVTCKWWALGNCTQSEEGCYYSHRNTGILLPDRKRPNKHWTCYDWLHSRCATSELDCMYAHSDTGLHVWRDGRPSFKHVTCFWWSKGGCKWDARSCKFAHEDTGLYSLDPADIWQGGSKFTTILSSGSTRPQPSRRFTGLSLRSTELQSAAETTGQSSHPPSSQGQAVKAMATKPHLTINTSSAFSTNEHHCNDPVFGRFPSSIGAPPQTPIEQSSDKTDIQLQLHLSSVFGHQPRIPDLPTPENDEELGPEEATINKPQPFCDGTSDDTASEDRNSMTVRAIVEASSRIPETSYQPGLLDSCPDLSQHQTTVISKSKVQEDGLSSRDPRLQRQGQNTDNLFDSALCDSLTHNHLLEEFSENITDDKALKQSKTPVSEDAARRGVRKCQKCYKPVFGSDICRVCGNQKPRVNTERPPKLSSTAGAQPAFIVEASISTTNNGYNLVKDGQEIGKHPILKTSVKRALPGSNIFLKSKRPRLSIGSMPSGQSRAELSARRPSDSRSAFNQARTQLRRERQTLEDLILQERRKNSKQNSDKVLDMPLVQSPISDGGKANEDPKKPAEQLTIQHDAMEQIAHSTPQAATTATSTWPTNSRTSSDTDLFSSPPQFTTKSISPHPQSANPEIQLLSETLSKTPAKPPVQNPWHEMKVSQPSEHRPVQPSLLEKSTAGEQIAPQSLSPTPQPLISNQIPSSSLRRPIAIHRSSSNDIVIDSSKFAWASAITCTQCQKHHKKCLHDNGGSLSAMKCREYVLSRKGKPDTSRSRIEWSAIVEASELGFESDSDDSDSETFETEKSLVIDDTDDDFATALGGDDDLSVENVEQVDQMDDNQFEMSFKKPMVRVNVPPRKPSFSVPNRFMDENVKLWTATKERFKKEELRKRGVMFESDSEYEDYDSDEWDAPAQTETPVDPLYIPPKVSKDLFEIAPELTIDTILQGMNAKARLEPRPSRKQQWMDVRGRQLQERRERFGNPHWEVDRRRVDLMVATLIERVVPPKDTDDRLAVGSVQTREENVSFADFLGAPRLPAICLMNDGERLAFQDGQKERDRIFGRTGRGLGKPTTDEEKWPIRPK